MATTNRHPFGLYLGLCLALAGAGCLADGTATAANLAATKQVPLPRPRPAIIAAGKATAPVARNAALAQKRPPEAPGLSAFAQANVGLHGSLFGTRTIFRPLARPAAGPFSVAPTTATSAADVALVKQVIEAARKGKETDADTAANAITDPVARKLAEWVILRSDNTNPRFQRYATFLNANPSWPHSPLFRRRAENALWNDKLDDSVVNAFFGKSQPTTGKGRFILARALLARGDRDGAQALVRHAWRNDECSADTEKAVLAMFGSMIGRGDEKVRMERRLYAEDVAAGLRAAERLGGSDVLIAKARAAVIAKQGNAKALLDAVPAAARDEAGYIFARVQFLRKDNKLAEASKLVLTAPKDPNQLVDLDQWWLERRLLVRKLLDDNDAQTAYRVARDAAPPMKGNYRVDAHFTAGWIALRFLHDAATAAQHFAHINEDTNSPHALARGGYWQGRAAEAMSQRVQAKAFYEVAAEHTATYYGQLARARLGITELGLRGPPAFTPADQKDLTNLEVVRAVEILYALDERDMLAAIYAELGESGTDVAGMAVLGETAGKYGDGRAMLHLGQGALSRGLPLDYYAFPIVGLPDYKPIGPPVDPAVT